MNLKQCKDTHSEKYFLAIEAYSLFKCNLFCKILEKQQESNVFSGILQKIDRSFQAK